MLRVTKGLEWRRVANTGLAMLRVVSLSAVFTSISTACTNTGTDTVKQFTDLDPTVTLHSWPCTVRRFLLNSDAAGRR